MIPTMFEISFETTIWGNGNVKNSYFVADFVLKSKKDINFVRDSNSGLNFITFQHSNVRELETIKYAYVRCHTHLLV